MDEVWAKPEFDEVRDGDTHTSGSSRACIGEEGWERDCDDRGERSRSSLGAGRVLGETGSWVERREREGEAGCDMQVLKGRRGFWTEKRIDESQAIDAWFVSQ